MEQRTGEGADSILDLASTDPLTTRDGDGPGMVSQWFTLPDLRSIFWKGAAV